MEHTHEQSQNLIIIRLHFTSKRNGHVKVLHVPNPSPLLPPVLHMFSVLNESANYQPYLG